MPAAPTTPPPPPSSVADKSGSIVTRTLACGMPLIVEQMSGVRSVGVSWLLPAGSATDPEDRQGISTMLAELLQRGAGELDSRAQVDAFDRLGVSRSADVSTAHMRVGFTLLGDRLAEALPLMVDMVRRPRMDEDSIEPTRDLSLQAIESLADDPSERARIAVKGRHNPWPLNRSGLGTAEGLRAITRHDLLGGWSRRARPEGSILGIAGDVAGAGGADGLARRLDTLLSGWSGGAEAILERPSTTRGTYHHIADKSSQVQIVLVHDAPAERHPDSVLERLAVSVLSGGMASRLFSEVREKRGLCYSVNAGYAADRDYGRGSAYVGTTPERAQESLDVLWGELMRINTEAGRAEPEELERALIGIKSNIVMSGESTGARASALVGDQYRLGRARTLDEVAAKYAAITLDQVNGYLARRTLGPTTIVTLGPAELKPPEAR